MSEFVPIHGSPIVLRRSRCLARNDYVEVYMDDVSFMDGHSGTHLRVCEPKGGTAVLVINEAEEVYLHRAYHYSANSFCLEIIRGYGETGDSAEKAALREFAEEAAFRAEVVGTPECIGEVYPNSTIVMSCIPVFVIRVRSAKATIPIEVNEGLSEGGWYSQSKLRELIAAGAIKDSFTLAAWSLFSARHSASGQPPACIRTE